MNIVYYEMFKGDIGGPLVTPALIGNHSVAVAIASFISANGCESLDPTGYTRIDSYNGWIKNATTYIKTHSNLKKTTV
jgi:secreted trypsin-like serine protease